MTGKTKDRAGEGMLDAELRARLLAFRKERDWKQFHNFRTLSTSIVLEAAELAELSQWTPDVELDALVFAQRERIEEELADLAILMTYLLEDLDIDLREAVARKLQLNAAKYPVARSRGTSLKYDRLPGGDGEPA